MNKKILLLLCLLGMLISPLFYVKEGFTPAIYFAISEQQLKALKPLFPSLDNNPPWAEEWKIGKGFYDKLDLTQAITAFKRAEVLSESKEPILSYAVLFCYYLGGKYSDVTTTFEKSALASVNIQFPAFHDLLVILYESYTRLLEDKKAEAVLRLIQAHFPQTFQKLLLWKAVISADFTTLSSLSSKEVDSASLLSAYESQKKSVMLSQVFNTLLPGLGYAYIHQTQSALTAFFLNGAFLWGAFHHLLIKSYGIGIVFLGFEAGWYYGGINGVGIETNLYNRILYESYAKPLLLKHSLFPIEQLNYGL